MVRGSGAGARRPGVLLLAVVGLLLAAAAGAQSSQPGASEPEPRTQPGEPAPEAEEGAGAGAQAEEEPEPPAPARSHPAPGVEEIVITAQKREQSLQEVPISVTAFDEQTLDDARIEALPDYVRLTPNLVLFGVGSPANWEVAIRGVSNLTPNTTNSFGIYVDEFNVSPASTTTTYDPELVDVQRIEVLRGPQGTHFGRNTIGGAISITTIRPDFETPSLNATVDYGSYETALTRLSGNLPLGERVALRGAGYWSGSNGFIRDTGPADNENDIARWGGRLAARFQPVDEADLELAVQYFRMEQGLPDLVPGGNLGPSFQTPIFPGTMVTLESFINQTLAPTLGGPTVPTNEVGFYKENHDRTSLSRRTALENQTTLATGRFLYDFDAFRLTAVGGWISNSFDAQRDHDNTSYTFFDEENDIDLDAWSAEARLASSDPFELPLGDLDWTAGVFYGRDQADFRGTIRYLEGSSNNPYDFVFGGLINTDPFFLQSSDNKVHSLALFGELTWYPVDRLELIAGGRWSHDDVDFSGRIDGDPAFIATGTNAGDDVFDDFSPRVVASWHWNDDLLTYASVSKGYKPGGFSISTVPGTEEYDPETAWNYEVGVKADLFDRRLRANLAAFYMDWSDPQVETFDPTSGLFFVQNADSARTRGFELELEALPLDGLDLRAGIGFVDARIEKFRDAFDPVLGDFVDASGNRLPLAPKWTISASAQYVRPLPFRDLEGLIRAEYSFVDDFEGDSSNNSLVFVQSRDLWNFRLGVRSGRATLVGYVENALDEVYYTGVGTPALSFSGTPIAVGRPRTFGVRLSYAWD